MADKETLEIKDTLYSRIKEEAESNALFTIEKVLSPRKIVVSVPGKISVEESGILPLSPVAILSYEELSSPPFGKGLKDPLMIDFAEKVIKEIEEEILVPKKTKVTVQVMPDSYYYDTESLRRKVLTDYGIPCVIYIDKKTYQSILVEKGYAIYDNREYPRLKDTYLQKGNVDLLFTEELEELETLAISKEIGIWDPKYAFALQKVNGELHKKVRYSQDYLKQSLERIKTKQEIRKKSTPEERLKRRLEAKEKERSTWTRKYSNTSYGDQISSISKRYLPRLTSEQIITGIVSGLLPKSLMQIGALWSGIPTYEEEEAGLGACSHPVEIVEIRKDGDVRPILGQGFLSMVMGDKPPNEGLTLIFTVNSRGIETFIAPLLTQFRMDPIIPIRNIHLARFSRPIFSNKELYSKVYGRLPDNIAKLVNPSGEYSSSNPDEVRELSRVLDLMYLTVPVYVAVKQVQVQNLKNNNGSYTVAVNCGIADVSENFGVFPEYFRTIDKAFEFHERRVTVSDKINTAKAIKYVSKQIGSGRIIEAFSVDTEAVTRDNKAIIKSYIDKIKQEADKKKESITSNFVLRDGKFIHIPETVEISAAASQAIGNLKSNLYQEPKGKAVFSRLLVYKPSVGTTANFSLMKSLLKVSEMTGTQEETNVLLNHFFIANGGDKQIPIPTGFSVNSRNGAIRNKSDIVPAGGTKSTSFINNALKIERLFAIDQKLLDNVNPYSALFAISQKNSLIKAYEFSYTNWKDESAIGLGYQPIIQPFELITTTPIGRGENTVVNNLEVEYACNYGLPMTAASYDESNKKIVLKPLVAGITDDGFSKNLYTGQIEKVESYEISAKKFDKSLTVISIPDNKNIDAVVGQVVSRSGTSTYMLPEMGAFFSHNLNPSDSSDEIADQEKVVYTAEAAKKGASGSQVTNKEIKFTLSSNKTAQTPSAGVYGSLKFHCGTYRGISYRAAKSGERPVLVKDKAGTREVNVGVARQDTDLWLKVNVKSIIGEEVKCPLTFTLSYKANDKILSKSFGLVDYAESDRGKGVFFLREVGQNPNIVAFVTSRNKEALLNLIVEYIKVIEYSEDKALTDKKRKSLIVKIRNIFQSVLNRQVERLVEVETPDALSNITQVLASIKGVNGTHFLDESEPYMFSLLYQLKVISGGKYSMTFLARPDRVPYIEPPAMTEDYETMSMTIYRPEPPREEERINAYTEALRQNETFIARIETQEGLDSFVTEKTFLLIKEAIGEGNLSLEIEATKPVYVIPALQELLLRYFDVAFSVYCLAKSGNALLSNRLRIKSPSNVSRREQGLISEHVEAAIGEARTKAYSMISALLKKTEGLKKSKKFKEDSKTKKPEISETADSLIKKGYSIDDIILRNTEVLKGIVDKVYERIYDAKTPSGKHFATPETIKRILSFSGLQANSSPENLAVISEKFINLILTAYKDTIDILVSKQKSGKLYVLHKGTITITGDFSSKLQNIRQNAESLLAVVRAVRLATGYSVDFVKKKKLSLRKPIPSIGIIEEYGVSEPIRIPGKTKPVYQVVGSTSVQAYIQLQTNISELYIGEKSKISNVIEEEEGVDAIYNILRDPNEVTTVYNMLRSGRAIVRNTSIFTRGSNSIFQVGRDNETLRNAFRLIKRASVESANMDALGTLLGTSEPHVEIREPLFLALGLSKFVAKTTKMSTGGDTSSWKLDVFLLPYEGGYSTSRNLSKVNRPVSNQDLGDIAAWFGAAYNPTVGTSVLGTINLGTNSDEKKTQKEQDFKWQAEKIGIFNTEVFEKKMVYTRYAISAVFSGLVAVHAIYKAKRKLELGIADRTLSLPDFFPEILNIDKGAGNISGESMTDEERARALSPIARSRMNTGFDIDLSAYDFTNSFSYGNLGQTASIPSSVGIGDIGALSALTVGGAAGAIAIEMAAARFGAKATSSLAKALFKFVEASFSIAVDVALAAKAAGDDAVNINKLSSDLLTRSIKNNASFNILLSQHFGHYALDFLKDFFSYEAENPGKGADFIAKIAEEAQSVISNAGSISGIAFFDRFFEHDGESPSTVSTASGAIVSTYPINAALRNSIGSEVRLSEERNPIKNLSIVIVNSCLSNKADITDKRRYSHDFMAGDMYGGPKAENSFFSRYYRFFLEQERKQNKKLRTEIDLCGEELLQLIVDGQLAMFATDIYSIVLAPKYILSDPSFYYAGLQGILGRLKLNHFAQYLVGPKSAMHHTMRVTPLFIKKNEQSQAGKLAQRLYRKYLGIETSENILKKVEPYENILRNVRKLFEGKADGDNPEQVGIKTLYDIFPLANGKAIIYRAFYSSFLIKEMVASKKIENPEGLEALLLTLSAMVTKLSKEMPPEKRPKVQVPRKISIANFLAGQSIAGTENQNFSETKLSASSVGEQINLSFSGKTKVFVNEERAIKEIKESVIEHIAWLLNAYGNLLDNVTKGDMKTTDPSYGLKEAILEQIAVTRSEELGISVENAREEIRSIIVNEGKLFENLSQSSLSSQVIKACDEIALYSGKSALGKKSLYGEYVQFLNTFHEMFMQSPMKPSGKNRDPSFLFIFDEMQTTEPNEERIKNMQPIYDRDFFSGKDSVWVGDDEEDLRIFTILLGQKDLGDDAPIIKQMRELRTISTSAMAQQVPSQEGVSNLSSFTAYDPTKEEESNVQAKLYSFATIRFGIERPEYIPAVLATWENINGRIYIRRTPICSESLALYANFFSATFVDKVKGFLAGMIYDNSPIFAALKALTVSLFIYMALKAVSYVLQMVGIVISTKAIIIIAVVTFFVILSAKFFNALHPEPASIGTFQKQVLLSLRGRLADATNIAVSPLFTGMKALLEQATGITEADLEIVSSLGSLNLPETDPRSVYWVHPPNIGNSIVQSEYILQDTLSYLTLPLITKSFVKTVSDVLSPGGHIIPNLKKTGESQSALSTALLVQEGFFKDSMERLPEYIEAEKIKALEANAPELNINPLEPLPNSVEYAYKTGAIRFAEAMESMFFGRGSTQLNKTDTELTIKTDEGNFAISAKEQLKKIYRTAIENIENQADIDSETAVDQRVISAQRAFPYRDKPLFDASMELVLKSGKISEKARAVEKFGAADRVYTLQSPTGDPHRDALLYADRINRIAFVQSEEYDSHSAIDSGMSINSSGKVTPKLDSDQQLRVFEFNASDKALKFGFQLWSGEGRTPPDLFLGVGSGQVTRVIGTTRGASSWFGPKEAGSVIIRQASPGSKIKERALNNPEEGIFLRTKSSSLLGHSSIDTIFLGNKGKIRASNLIEERVLFVFPYRLGFGSGTISAAIFREGMALVRGAEFINTVYSQYTNVEYMKIPFNQYFQKESKHNLSFVEMYAAKIAYDEQLVTPEKNLVITWGNIAQALQDIGNYFMYVSFLKNTHEASGGKENQALTINKTNKVSVKDKATSIKSFSLSNETSVELAAAQFAATTGLTTQFVIDKIEEFMDKESITQWDSFTKVSKEMRDIVNSPMKMYPVVKLYFIRKMRGEAILYDDIYSYADVISVKIFDSTKTPGSTILIQIANTENKIDNIITSRDNARNPFEVPAKGTDQLSGVLLKAGTRIMVYLGYGNILNEENKYLAEISSVSYNNDGTITIEARGPGWILNSPITAYAGKGGTKGKVVSIEGREVRKARLPVNPTDPEIQGVQELTDFANPVNLIARNTILYTLLEATDISKYGRLGSLLNDTAEYMSGIIPPNLENEYSVLIQNGFTSDGFSITKWLNAQTDILARALLGTQLPESASTGIVARINSSIGTSQTAYTVNTLAKNVLLSESYPMTLGTVSSISNFFGSLLTKLDPFSENPVIKLDNETFWEFIKEMLLPIANAKAFVRSYETDGSLVIGEADDFYSMYFSKSLLSRMAENLFKEVIVIKETGSYVELLTRFTAAIRRASRGEPEAKEFIAQILTGTIVSMLYSDLDYLVIKGVIDKCSATIAPIVPLGRNSFSEAGELLKQLYDSRIQSFILNEIAIILSKVGVVSTQQGERGIEAKLGDTTKERYDNSIAVFTLLPSAVNKKGKYAEYLKTAIEMAFRNKLDAKKIMASEIKLSSLGESVGNAERCLYHLVSSVARAINNKIHKVRILSPEKRKVQESFFMFSGRDIIHNEITTMLGYNEGEFVFTPSKADSASILGSEVSRFPFYVDRISAEGGATRDYSSKRMIVNLNNPSYYRDFMDLGDSGDGSLITVLSMMASEQLAQLIRDWYGGNVFTYGDTEKKPNDTVMMVDFIRDMYGPFEIKEVVHSFDNLGFISAYVPSVYTRTEPRNIKGESRRGILNYVVNAVMYTLTLITTYMGLKLGLRIVGKIPGAGRYMNRVLLPKATGLMPTFSAIVKGSSDNVKRAERTMKSFVSAVSKKVKPPKTAEVNDLRTLWLKTNGFKSEEEFKTAFAAWKNAVTENDIKFFKSEEFAAMRQYFSDPKNVKPYQMPNGLTYSKQQFESFVEIEELLNDLLFSKRNILASATKGTNIEINGEKINRLAELYTKVDIRSTNLGSTYNGYADFIHFVFGKTYQTIDETSKATVVVRSVSNVAPHNIAVLRGVLGSVEDMFSDLIVTIGLRELSGLNEGIEVGVKTASRIKDTDKVREALVNGGKSVFNGIEEIFIKQKLPNAEMVKIRALFVEVKTPEEARDIARRLLDAVETSVKTNKQFVKLPNSTEKIALTEDFIKSYKARLVEQEELIKSFAEQGVKAVNEVVEELGKIASGTKRFEELPDSLKQIILKISDTVTEAKKLEIEKLKSTISGLDNDITRVKSSTTLEENAKKEALKTLEEKKRLTEQEIKKRRKELTSIETGIKGEEITESLANLIKREVSERRDIVKDSFAEIATRGIQEMKEDSFAGIGRAITGDGRIDENIFTTIRKTMKEERSILFSGNTLKSKGEIMKSISNIFKLYTAQSLLNSLLGDSLLSYNMLLGADKASKAVKTEFLIYRGEPYLSNLEGLTRDSSRLLSDETTYFDYLKSRFYDLDQISQFMLDSFGLFSQAAVTQYTDVLRSSTIDSALYTAVGSDSKFFKVGLNAPVSPVGAITQEDINRLGGKSELNIKKISQFKIEPIDLNSVDPIKGTSDNQTACHFACIYMMLDYYKRNIVGEGIDVDQLKRESYARNFIKQDFTVEKPEEIAKLAGFTNEGELKYNVDKNPSVQKVADLIKQGHPVLIRLQHHSEVAYGYFIDGNVLRLKVHDPGGQGDTLISPDLKAYKIKDGKVVYSTVRNQGRVIRTVESISWFTPKRKIG